MTDPNHRLKRRAAKILALALNNPSKEEAAAAMRIVRKLISKHGFTLDELRAPTVDKRFGSSNTASAQMPPPFSSLCLAKAASLLTDTVFVLDCTTNTILFRGMNGENEVALMMYEYLEEALERSLNAAKASSPMAMLREAQFRLGFGIAVYKRAELLKADRTRRQPTGVGADLMVLKAELIEEHFPTAPLVEVNHPASGDDGYSRARGILAGAKTGLDPQVAAEASRRLAE